MPTDSKPKPITLGIFESLEYMNNGIVPRRSCRVCAVLGGIVGYCLGMASIAMFVLLLPRLIAYFKGFA